MDANKAENNFWKLILFPFLSSLHDLGAVMEWGKLEFKDKGGEMRKRTSTNLAYCSRVLAISVMLEVF